MASDAARCRAVEHSTRSRMRADRRSSHPTPFSVLPVQTVLPELSYHPAVLPELVLPPGNGRQGVVTTVGAAQPPLQARGRKPHTRGGASHSGSRASRRPETARGARRALCRQLSRLLGQGEHHLLLGLAQFESDREAEAALGRAGLRRRACSVRYDPKEPWTMVGVRMTTGSPSWAANRVCSCSIRSVVS